MNTNTIAAIATAVSPAGLSVIRISGEDAFSIIDKIYRSKGGKKKLSEQPSHTIHYGYIYDGEEMIDEVLVLLMRAPKTFTTEDTVEIDCHGGILVTRKILDTVVKYGASLAEPGEFTKRAFLNGRMDLSEAEAVLDVIHAKNEFALQASVKQLKGSVAKKIRELRNDILDSIAFIESALDDPEHISIDGYDEQLKGILATMQKELKRLAMQYQNGRMLSEGIKTVILGKPNAGKSSLMNRLTGQERAIVTEIAGTTRDTLEEQIQIGGIGFQMIDTAGIRNTADIVEKIGVERAKQAAEEADLILYVVDASQPLDESDLEIISMIEQKKAIILLNKTDLEAKLTIEELKDRCPSHPILMISAKTEEGMETLETTLQQMFMEGKISFNDEVYITNARHKECLDNSIKSIEKVLESIEAGLPEDFYTIDLMDAYSSLGLILGEAVEEDLVNRIFSKFCMGK